MSARLEDLLPGTLIGGVVLAKDVSSVALSWHGSAAVTLTYRNLDGRVGERLLYRSDEQALEVRGVDDPHVLVTRPPECSAFVEALDEFGSIPYAASLVEAFGLP